MRSMNSKEKAILKKVVEDREGLLSPANYLNSIAGKDRQSAHRLIASGYVQEVPTTMPTGNGDRNHTFYRATEKGRIVFEPLPKRLWYAMKSDIRTIMIAAITAIVVTIVTIIITNLFGQNPNG
jgi:hypothetical protein